MQTAAASLDVDFRSATLDYIELLKVVHRGRPILHAGKAQVTAFLFGLPARRGYARRIESTTSREKMRKVLMVAALSLAGYPAVADDDLDCARFNTPEFFAMASPETVGACIEQGVDIVGTDEGGSTALIHAVRHSANPSVIDKLLASAQEQERLDVILRHRDADGRGIMHIAAAEAQDPAVLTWLASWGAEVRDTYDCGEGWFPGCTEPMHLAAQRRDGFIYAATLLAVGSLPAPVDRYDRTPADLVRPLGRDYHNVLALWSPGGWPDLPESRAGVHVIPEQDARCDTFLTAEFFQSASVEEVNVCLAAGSNPTANDSEGNTAIHLAAANASDPSILDVMLHHLREQNPDRVANALNRTNLNGRTALHYAAEFSETPEVLGRLLAWGADVNSLAEPIERRRLRSDRGTTPLHIAARRADPSREQILTVLLAGGANTLLQDHDTRNRGGRQALHYAASNPIVRVVLLLQEAQLVQASLISEYFESVIRDDHNRTALHVITQSDADLETISKMLAFPFSADDRDSGGWTPLMFSAAQSTDPDVFFLLLRSSRRPCVAAADGTTVTALLRRNETLMEFDPTGGLLSPLEAYRERCPR